MSGSNGQTNAIVSGLQSDRDVVVRVRTYNKVGVSEWSSADRLRTMVSPALLTIHEACFPQKGASKDPYLAFQTLWGLTNAEIVTARKIYQRKFGQDLKEVLHKLTSGPFQLATLMVLDTLRVEFGQLHVRIDGATKLYNIHSTRMMNPFLKLSDPRCDLLRRRLGQRRQNHRIGGG